jgi:hypothetical protein
MSRALLPEWVDEKKVGAGSPRMARGALSRSDILTIARRFNAGGTDLDCTSPEGTADYHACPM